MTRVIYVVEVSGSRYEPYWTETVTTKYKRAVRVAEAMFALDPFLWVRLVEWEKGERVRTTDYGRED